MNRLVRTCVIAALAAVALASCATVPVAQRPERVAVLLEEINTGSLERVLELTGRPFLLDGEILVRPDDIETMWTNLREAGFTFDGATVVDLGAATPAGGVTFGDTMDVRVWFERYAGPEAGLATVNTSHGTFLIVTGGRVGRTPQLLGFTEDDR